MPAQAVVGLAVAEDGLAEEVEVEAGAVFLESGDRSPELDGPRVGDEVADHRRRTRRATGTTSFGKVGARAPPSAHGRPHVPGQERRDARGERVEVARGDREVFGADDPVDEADREGQAGLVFEDLGEKLGRIGAGCAARLVHPAVGESDGFGAELGRDSCADGGGGAFAGAFEGAGRSAESMFATRQE